MAIRRELFAGEVLYRQGEPSDCAWLVEEGTIELVAAQGGAPQSHGLLLGPGELIGELGLLEGAPRSATATAREDAVLLAVDLAQFRERLDGGDPIVRTLVDSLLRRMRALAAHVPEGAALPAEDVPVDDPGERSGVGRIRLEAQLRHALESGTLEVHYQPIHDLAAGAVRSFEALVRWQLPGRGPVSPAEFIQLAEETSLIVPVGEYVLERVLELLAALRGRGDALPSIAVNLSAKQLVEPGMARHIVQRVQRAGLPAGTLKLEVTESRMLDYAPVATVMKHCREHGIPFALDDFGTGYSNLTHLHKLDFEYVKVDQAFCRHMFDGPRPMAIVEAIVDMAHRIGAQVIMEGVETRAQLARLEELGVRHAQGYLIGKAAPVDQVLSGEAMRGLAAQA